MKKRILVVLLVILALSTLMLVSCKKHTCDFSTLKETKTEATCTEAGTGIYECECGETTEKEIPAKGHTNETKTVEATCKDNGYTIDVCTVCKTESNKTVTESASDKYHKFDKVIDEPADCKTNKKGRKGTVCSICEAQNPKQPLTVVDPIHEWDDPIIVPATCTEPGSETVKCKNCPFIKGVNPLDPLGHDWEADESTRVAANCDHGSQVTNVCGTCGATEVVEANDKREHDLFEDIIPATCDTAAIVYEECSYDDCDYYREIASQGQMLGHDIAGAEYVTVPETCTTPGSRTPICNRCELPVTYDPLLKQDLVEIIDPCAHFAVSSYAPAGTKGYEVTETVEASCHNERYENWKCISDPACNETKTEYYGGKLEHVYVNITDVYPDAQLSYAPTCVSIGYDLQICTNCILAGTGNEYQCEGDGETPCYKHVKTAEKSDHDITTVKLSSYKDSTCINPATIQYNCQYCNQDWEYTYPTEDTGAAQVGSYTFVPLKEHGGWAYANQSIEATCTSYGYELYQCTVDEDCTYVSQREQTRYAEHRFTKNEDGRFTCTTCGTTYRDISTLMEEYIDQGFLDMDGVDGYDPNGDFWYYVIGYENPDDPTGITANEKFSITFSNEIKTDDEGNEIPQIGVDNGLIMLQTSADLIEYSIVITDYEGNKSEYTIVATFDSDVYRYTITPKDKEDYEAADTVYQSVEPYGNIVYFDLYSEGEVASIEITSTEDATVRLFAYDSKEAPKAENN